MSAAYTQMAALAEHLRTTITVANGYPFDIGTVGIGQAALAVGSQATLPAITLTITQDLPAGNQTGNRIEASTWHQSWERIIELEGKVDQAEWDQALDGLLDAIRRALVRFQHVTWMTGALLTRPVQSGDTATLAMQLALSYQADYSPD